ncbi:MAG: carbohydrate-binding protein, partial [Mastigocoleus sp.]
MTQIRIEAEDYNSYSDSSNGNEGGAYRSDNVDIESTSDVGGGYNVGWIESGESLTYNFNVTESGTYKLVSRVASARSGDHSFQVSIAGQETRLNLINTGGWQNWKNVESTQNFTLNAGSNTLRVDMIGDLFNINYFDLVKVEGDSGSTASNPDNGGSNENSGEESPTPNSSTNSLRIEAEDYNSYSDNTNGNLGGAYRSDNVDIQNTSDV